MSNKSSRQSQSPSPSTPSSSKLSKFLPKRDRSKSMVDSPGGSVVSVASSSSSSISHQTLDSPNPSHRSIICKGSKKASSSKRRQSQDTTPLPDSPELEETDDQPQPRGDDTPVIVEPVTIPRPSRIRSERPLSENFPQSTYYPSTSSNRLSDLPSRLSGWFQHTFTSSSTDLTLPTLLSQQHISGSSPKGKGSALLTAAKHGKGHIDKAMRYLLDSDATPDMCPDPIWLLGVEHPGYEPDPPPQTNSLGRSTSTDSRPASLRSSTSASASPTIPAAEPSLSKSQPPSSTVPNAKDPSRNWPPVFYADFTSRIWLTYRSQFLPIRDITLAELDMPVGEGNPLSSSPQPKKWNWPLGGEKCWSSDAGWGCMVRTGQSLLANALLHIHLGRDWRKPPHPVYTADYATYVQILTWFLDDPSPMAPFSVHRMVLVGKQLGTKVGQWFGPSIAAGAIKTLVHAFPEAGLGVYISSDGGAIYDTEVLSASHSGIGSPRRRRHWGDRPVLILIGHRLGLNGVNPIYYDTIKAIYTWPQSVGIAGGRPSSSYYFVGSQAENLFYLDPHHARPAIPLRPPPQVRTPEAHSPSPPPPGSRHASPEPISSDRESYRSPPIPVRNIRSPTSPSSVRSGVSSASRRNVVSPSPLQYQMSTSSASTMNSYTTSVSHSSASGSHARWRSSSVIHETDSQMDCSELGINGEDLDPLQRHYVTAYSAAELKTFHCDRVRKMPLSGLDPSMLIGFLCKDEADWHDLKRRIAELNSKSKATVFTVQDEPPNWNSDSEMGLESMSEPDIDLPEEDDAFSDEERPPRSASASPDTSLSVPSSRSKSADGGDTEEDPVGPLTPGPGRSSFTFEHVSRPSTGKIERSTSTSTTGSASTGGDSLDFEDEEDEDWATPDREMFTSQQEPISPQALESSLATLSGASRSTNTSADTGETVRKKSKKKSSGSKPSSPQQLQQQHFPFPATQSSEDEDERGVNSPPKRVPQMRTAKARDGGRTQSGGVRGVPVDDFDTDDF